ncbi:MAG: hypothetical protein PHQ05_09860 [Sterolibacterium sp.]|nr:hypothetical protein [Sterolibacterium sp.]
MDKLLTNTLSLALSSIGTDPDGWDKPMTPDEIEEFMKFNNSDRSIETVNLGPSDDRNQV